MGSTLGKNINLTVFGESHGPYVGATLSGLPSGIKINLEYINQKMRLRKGGKPGTTNRVEEDEINFISGVRDGYTNGNPITVLIKNKDYRDEDYNLDIARPSHGDYTNYLKYGEFGERIGGGFYSARTTAPIVALCAIIQEQLEKKNIFIKQEIVYDEDKQNNAIKNNDSLGALVVSKIQGLEDGVGEPYFDSLESNISHALFSIPGVKGVSFGLGFDYLNKCGSEVNDQFDVQNNKVVTTTNNCGGINGGISNGQEITINTVFKPAASVGTNQNVLNLKTKEIQQYQINGRHDACIAIRGSVVISSLVAFVVLDLLLSIHGVNYLK